MQKNLNYYLLLTLVLTLGFGQLFRFEYRGIPFFLHDALVALILFLNLSLLRRALRSLSHSLSLFLLGLALGWIFALFTFSPSLLLLPFLYSLRLISYLTLYFLIKDSQIHLSPIHFLISGGVTLALGLGQYHLWPDMRIFQYLGWDDHLYRLTLPHFDPTFTAVLLSLAFLFAVSSSPLARLLSLLYLPGILLTYSRSVWLSLVMTALVFIKSKKLLLISGIILLISLIALPRLSGEGTNLWRTYSLTARWQTDLAYLQNSGWSLLFGQGLNTLGIAHASSAFPVRPSGPNNSYLYLLLTSGILGLWGWGKFMVSLYRPSTLKPLLLFFFFASLFNNVMFYSFALLWVLLATATAPSEA